jgi:hypothetical protein
LSATAASAGSPAAQAPPPACRVAGARLGCLGGSGVGFAPRLFLRPVGGALENRPPPRSFGPSAGAESGASPGSSAMRSSERPAIRRQSAPFISRVSDRKQERRGLGMPDVPCEGSSSCENPHKEHQMLKPELPASPLTRIEIEVSDTLLAALQKAPPGKLRFQPPSDSRSRY